MGHVLLRNGPTHPPTNLELVDQDPAEQNGLAFGFGYRIITLLAPLITLGFRPILQACCVHVAFAAAPEGHEEDQKVRLRS